MHTVFTIGYEGASLSDFIATLEAAKVERVIDVRELPQSRRAGFSKNVLRTALEVAGIGYEHRKPLGDPKPGRDAARAGRHDEFRQIFTAHMETTAASDALSVVAEVVKNERCVLLCYERDHKHCHRSILCDQLQRLGSFQVRHLGVNPVKRSERVATNGAEWHDRAC